LLGEDALDAELDIDRASEAALEELEDICGAGVNVDPSSIDIGTGSRDPLEVLGEIAGEQTGTQKVVECLSESAVADFVALGSSEICLWRLKHPPYGDGLCMVENLPEGVAPPTTACPRAVEHDDECTTPTDENGTDGPYYGEYETIRVDAQDTLNLFEHVDIKNSMAEAYPGQCEDIRRLRQAITSGDTLNHVRLYWFKAIAASTLYDSSSVSSLAPAVRWEAFPGDYSALYIDGNPWLKTGDIETGPLWAEGSGICDASHTNWPFDCPSGDTDSLFCSRPSCLNVGARSQFNARLANAAAAVRWLGQQSLDGFRTVRCSGLPGDRNERQYFEDHQSVPIARFT
jgi:hypothetical protein